jgi:hypothetical protein
MRLGLILILWATGASAQVVLEPSDFPPPPGYPPPLGEVVLHEHGRESLLTTYDFSIGAFDASAWLASDATGPVFHLTAYPDAKAETGLLRLSGQLDGDLPAVLVDPLVEINLAPGFVGRRWSSAGQRVEITLEELVPDDPEAGSGYARFAGHFEARLCSADRKPVVIAPGARCRSLSGRFETRGQVSP